MTVPVYKIEVYDSTPDLIHTITSDAINISTTEILTSGVGAFSFSVPTKKGSDYAYDDVAVFDKVKIWFGYDSVSGDPDFVGRILRINAPLSTETGYVRTFKGRSQGEILLRNLKQNKHWEAENASDIVEELADDLSLGKGDVASDTTDVTLTVKTETYFDLLKKN